MSASPDSAGNAMTDIVFLVLTIVFFAVSVAYARWLDRV
jgi:hypothetical protein